MNCFTGLVKKANGPKSCRRPVVSFSYARKSYRVRADLHGTIFVACDKRTTGLSIVAVF